MQGMRTRESKAAYLREERGAQRVCWNLDVFQKSKFNRGESAYQRPALTVIQ